jgi:hypothetical protein
MNMKLNKETNPHVNADGAPSHGQEPQFFAWARERELERRKSLPEAEVKELEESEQALVKRMNF